MGTIIRNMKHKRENRKHPCPKQKHKLKRRRSFQRTCVGRRRKNVFSGARRHPGFEEAAGLCVCYDVVTVGYSKKHSNSWIPVYFSRGWIARGVQHSLGWHLGSFARSGRRVVS